MNRHDMDKELDNRLDALLCTRPLSAGPDFARRTLERLHSMPEVDDALVDACLARQPVVASQSFTARALRAATHRPANLYLRPLLAAAASLVVSLGSIAVLESASTNGNAPAQPGYAELASMADDLRYAAPLLETGNAETIAALTLWTE